MKIINSTTKKLLSLFFALIIMSNFAIGCEERNNNLDSKQSSEISSKTSEMDNTVDNSSLDSSSIDDNSSKDNNSYVSEIIDIEEPFSQISISMLEIVLEESLNKKTAINGIVFTDESAEEINGTANSNQSVKHIEMTLGDSETIKEAISLLIEWEKAGKTPEDEELLKLPLKLIATYQVNIVEKLYPIVLLMSNSNKTQATQNLDRLLKNISTTDNKSGWTFTYTTDDNNKFVFIATYTG